MICNSERWSDAPQHSSDVVIDIVLFCNERSCRPALQFLLFLFGHQFLPEISRLQVSNSFITLMQKLFISRHIFIAHSAIKSQHFVGKKVGFVRFVINNNKPILCAFERLERTGRKIRKAVKSESRGLRLANLQHSRFLLLSYHFLSCHLSS